MRVVPAVNNSGGQRENSAARGVKFPAPVGRRRHRRGASGAGESAPAFAPEDGKKILALLYSDQIASKPFMENCLKVVSGHFQRLFYIEYHQNHLVSS